MLRLIVTSATYRQSSRVTPELLAARPGEPAAGAGPAAPAAGRDDPRPGAGAERAARRAARRPVGASRTSRRGSGTSWPTPRLRPGPRRRASTAAASTPSGSGRSPRRRWSTFDAAGPRDLHRPRGRGPTRRSRRSTLLNDVDLRRGRPGPGRADHARRRATTPEARLAAAFRLADRPRPPDPTSWRSCSTGLRDHLARFRATPRAADALIRRRRDRRRDPRSTRPSWPPTRRSPA